MFIVGMTSNVFFPLYRLLSALSSSRKVFNGFNRTGLERKIKSETVLAGDDCNSINVDAQIKDPSCIAMASLFDPYFGLWLMVLL